MLASIKHPILQLKEEAPWMGVMVLDSFIFFAYCCTFVQSLTLSQNKSLERLSLSMFM